MNDDMLSQDEIDALLNINNDDHENDHEDTNDEEKYKLTSVEMDTLGEIGNISFGSSATTLSTLLNQKVEITTPSVTVVKKEEIVKGYTFEPVSIQVNYIEGFSGNNVFVIKARDASVIADIMIGGDGTNPSDELDEIHLSAVQEAMNQMMGTAATSMSTIFDKKIDISPPSILVGTDGSPDIKKFFQEDAYVQVSFRLMVGDLIDSNMMQIIPIDFAKEMVDQLTNKDTSTADEQPEAIDDSSTSSDELTTALETEPIKSAQPQSMLREQQPEPVKPREEPQVLGNNIREDAAVQQASFTEFEKVDMTQTNKRNLDMLLDIPLKVTVELGKTKRSVKDILDLSAGSIIELDKLAGEPVDILVNGKLIAEGEVVVIDENFGVRVTDIISATDRIMSLK